jgi:hypothetical protein
LFILLLPLSVIVGTERERRPDASVHCFELEGFMNLVDLIALLIAVILVGGMIARIVIIPWLARKRSNARARFRRN